MEKNADVLLAQANSLCYKRATCVSPITLRYPLMKTIFEAKKHFRDRYRLEEGFVGVGIGLDENAYVLRVYVEDEDFPIK